ncbi:MAG: hypothetical protein HYV27_01065 [Candidatus Hydrogenedentes bacterium]|nr:hypothetical protein [Candidatus Hydrogenedentota bacterium]
MASRLLNENAVKTLNRFGDILFPRNGEYPSFSELGCAEHVDDIAAHAPAEDIALLGSFMATLRFAPGFVLRGIVWATQNADRFPEPIGTNLRLLDMGIRSLTVTLYYSGKKGAHYTGPTPLNVIDFHLTIVRD